MSAPKVLLTIIDRPRQAFEGVIERPQTWWLAVALLIIGTAALSAVSAVYAIDLANERSTAMIERITESMPEIQAESVRERSRPMDATRYWIGVGIALGVAALGWVIRGTVIHFSSMAFGGMSTWLPTFAIVVWSQIPYFVRNVVQTIYVWLNGELVEHQGLGFLVASGDWMQDSRNLQYAALSQVDPFALWHVLLLTIGIAVATRVGKGSAAVLAIVVWGIFVALALVPTLVGRAFMS